MKKCIALPAACAALLLAPWPACAGSSGRSVPSPALLKRMNEGPDVIGIVHWGLNTYTDREWGFGDEDPARLNPSAFDADQIVTACRDGGLGGLVVVAKHHDGFCLWPTRTTDHNISKSPFRGGKGDYVREMERACRKAGIRFGVYVSPWDRNNGHYGTPEYVRLYHEQIRELLSGDYGEVFEMWFDGANGGDGWYGGANEKRVIPSGYYRFDEVFAFVRRLQPNVCIFAGESDSSDFRWPGNERGVLHDDSRASITSVGGFANGEYGNPDYAYQINVGSPSGRYFRVCESDFPLRRGWFYHAGERGTTKNAAYLMRLYLGNVGNGGTMNIGVAPNRDGVLDEEDVRALKGFAVIKEAFFAHEVERDGEPFNLVVMAEDISCGEQVDHWTLYGDGRWLAGGRAIGRRRIRLLGRPVSPKKLELRISAAGSDLQPVKVRRYLVDVGLARLVANATADAGETDTARWMTGKGK
ncbi:MAG: alpha-L-fucosidase [Kiritimatiellae bacterium]|nr:alpha-L-fucosidase [Kiritimatiellia bacterium]